MRDIKAIRNSWDFLIISPLVLRYLRDRQYPLSISATALKDHLLALPEMADQRIVRLDWTIARALNDHGYRRTSVTGASFIRTFIGIQTVPDPAEFRSVPIFAIPISE